MRPFPVDTVLKKIRFSALRAGTTISDSPPAAETPPLDDVTAGAADVTPRATDVTPRGGDVTGSRPSSRYSTPESVESPSPTGWDIVEYLAVQVSVVGFLVAEQCYYILQTSATI